MVDYSEQTVLELDTTGRLISALYWNMNDFPLFRALTTLYFAAVSFAEAGRRLDPGGVDPGFLLRTHPTFGPAMRLCVARAIEHGQTNGSPARSRSIQADIRSAIQSVDVIGIGRSDRTSRFPADNADLFLNRHKLGASHEDIERLIERCGLSR